MALSTYAELQTQVANFLNRDDLTAQIPTFIQLAESSMNRKLRHWRMEKRSTATLDAQYSEVPGDWLETIQFDITGASETSRLRMIGHADMSERRYANGTAGRPCFYALTGGDFEFYPTPDDDYTGELVYYASLAALSDANTSNWLLEYAPDAYLYGALTHSAPYLHEDGRLAVWGGLYADVIAGLNAESDKAKYSGTGLKLRIR